jgi:hypothetical protein
MIAVVNVTPLRAVVIAVILVWRAGRSNPGNP